MALCGLPLYSRIFKYFATMLFYHLFTHVSNVCTVNLFVQDLFHKESSFVQGEIRGHEGSPRSVYLFIALGDAWLTAKTAAQPV